MEPVVAILGAGLAGLTAGLELSKRNVKFLVLESAERIGGLCQTGAYQHWRYDYGVKAIYSQNAAVMNYIRSLPVEFIEHQRQVRIHHCSDHQDQGIDIPYPFENGIGQLPHEDKVACVLGYLQATSESNPFSNFHEWIIYRLGSGIANQFMIPYNQKIWDCPLSEISMGLVAGKIHPASLEEIVRVALGEKIIGRPYQARFIYPRAGLSTMIEAMAQPISDRIRLNFGIERIVAKNNGYDVESVQGERVHCDSIISTLPLPLLGSLVEPRKWDVPQWRFNNTLFYMVFLDQSPDQGLHWHFFASPQFPFYRLTYMHNFSDLFPPCIVAEVTERGEMISPELIVAGLERIGVERSSIRDVQVERKCFTYPIPTIRSDAEKPYVIEQLEARHIYPLGRAGSWSYLNIDGIIAQVWDKIPQILAKEKLAD
jgi:protoporphyrinogen oxidase